MQLWTEINVEMLHKLIRMMPRCMRAIVKAKFSLWLFFFSSHAVYFKSELLNCEHQQLHCALHKLLSKYFILQIQEHL